jgi:hypothetical protein
MIFGPAVALARSMRLGISSVFFAPFEAEKWRRYSPRRVQRNAEERNQFFCSALLGVLRGSSLEFAQYADELPIRITAKARRKRRKRMERESTADKRRCTQIKKDRGFGVGAFSISVHLRASAVHFLFWGN